MYPGGTILIPEQEGGWPEVDSLAALQQLVPELEDFLERRYTLLKVIRNLAPVGRRQLATQVGSSERIIRAELDLLRDQGLVVTSSVGVSLF